MSTPQPCPTCGTPLASPAALCPACLLKQGLQTNTAGFTQSAPASPWQPPDIPLLAPLFPELDILQLIGRGGMGAVYLARQKNLDRTVALKILPPALGTDPAFADRFAREAQAMARLNHPHIVTIYDFGTRTPPLTDSSPLTTPLYFFLMEFVDGMNLRNLLDSGHIATNEALAIVPQICDALQYAHDQGIVHRDIKPENILLNKQGQVKIADFGLAKLIGKTQEPNGQAPGEDASPLVPQDSSLTPQDSIPAGTPQYMAPEQLSRSPDVDHRADIYSLGIVFYQLLTGELPTKNLQPPSRKVLIDVRLDHIVLRALEQSPELRFQNATQFKTEIETILNSPITPEIPHPETSKQKFQIKSPPPAWHRALTLVGTRDGIATINWPGVVVQSIIFLGICLFANQIRPQPISPIWAVIFTCFIIAPATLLKYQWHPNGLIPLDPLPPDQRNPTPPPQPTSTPAREETLLRAQQDLKIPAIGLRLTAYLNLILLLTIAALFAAWSYYLRTPGTFISGIVLFPFFFSLLANLILLRSAIRMAQCRDYARAVIASILALFAFPANIIGIPMGIWSLILLNRRHIKDAFETAEIQSSSQISNAKSKTPSSVVPPRFFRTVSGIVAILMLGILVFNFINSLPLARPFPNDRYPILAEISSGLAASPASLEFRIAVPSTALDPTQFPDIFESLVHNGASTPLHFTGKASGWIDARWFEIHPFAEKAIEAQGDFQTFVIITHDNKNYLLCYEDHDHTLTHSDPVRKPWSSFASQPLVQPDGSAALPFKVDPVGAAYLADLSAANKGRPLVILYNDRVVNAPIIRSQISSAGIITFGPPIPTRSAAGAKK